MEQQPQEEPNPLMRKKKTPEELAAEAEQEDLDDFTSNYFHHFSSIFIYFPQICLSTKCPTNCLKFHFLSTFLVNFLLLWKSLLHCY